MGLWNLISLGGSICMQIVWQEAIIFEHSWILTILHFFLIKLQMSYFLASNSRTKGIGQRYTHIYIYLIAHRYAHTLAYSSINLTTPKMHIYTRSWFIWFFFGFARAETDMWCFYSWCAAFFPTPNQRNWKESWNPVPNTTSDSEARYQWLMKFWPLIYLDPTSRESNQWQPSGSI